MENETSKCKCGRSLQTPHCYNCGQAKIYRFAKKRSTRVIDIKTGITKDFAVFRCDKCGVFDEFQLLYECKAPDLLTSQERKERRKDELWMLYVNPGPQRKMADSTIEQEYKKLFGITIMQDRIILASAYDNGLEINGMIYLSKHPEICARITRTTFWDSAAKTEEQVIQELEKEKQDKIIKEKEQYKPKGIRRLSNTKWKFSSGTLPPTNMVGHKQETAKPGSAAVLHDIPTNISKTINTPIITNTEIKEITEKTNGDSNVDNVDISSGINNHNIDIGPSNGIKKKARSSSAAIFEGKLTDDDLRNIPGVMALADDE